MRTANILIAPPGIPPPDPCSRDPYGSINFGVSRFAGAGEQSGRAAVEHGGGAQLPDGLHPVCSPGLRLAEE